MEKAIEQVKDLFCSRFGNMSNARMFFAPGRVNLIGEHIDYNGGLVLPCALTHGTYAIARENGLDRIRLASVNFDTYIDTGITGMINDPSHDWANYPKSVVDVFSKKGFSSKGFDMAVCGTIPNGAGLSSSASIELVTAKVISTLFSFDIAMIDMIKLCQKAENEFIRMNCGIMDQFAIGMGKKDNLLSIDCNTLEYKYVPCILGEYSLLIANTNKKRGLTDSKYNERRKECDMALEILKKHKPVNYLCDLSLEQYSDLSDHISNPVLKKRALHAVSENDRVKRSVALLKEGNRIPEFGKLMNESHWSLQNDYEVTGKELDTLTDEMRKIDGVAGARMTGAGFGGCAVVLVLTVNVKHLIERVSAGYESMIGYPPAFYNVEIGDGPSEIFF